MAPGNPICPFNWCAKLFVSWTLPDGLFQNGVVLPPVEEKWGGEQALLGSRPCTNVDSTMSQVGGRGG